MTGYQGHPEPLWHESRKTCLAYSPGGHMAELERALRGISFDDVFHVTFADGRRATEVQGRVYRISHPRRRLWRTIVNAFQSIAILARERPKLIISTGADVAVPTLLFGRIMGARIIFIESGGSVGPTLSGRLVYPFADTFIVQWPSQRAHYPNSVLASGPLL